MSVLSKPRFHDEAAAFDSSKAWCGLAVWFAAHCGVVGGRVYKLDGVRGKPSKKARTMVVDNVRAER